MAWVAPPLVKKLPGESDEDWWNRERRSHNKYVARFNADIFNKIFRRRLDPLPTYFQMMQHSKLHEKEHNCNLKNK